MLLNLHRVLLMIFLIILPSIKSRAEINGIILHQNDGATTLISFNDMKEITFSSDRLTIGNKSYPLSNIKRYEFCDIADPSKVETVGSETIDINPKGVVTFANENDALKTHVYDLQGHEYLFTRSGTTIDFSNLASGIYIVVYGQKAVKIIKE